MRVLVWGINYAPEVTGIGPCNTALCERLLAAGHTVEMVTSFPYYPAWRKRAEDRVRIWRTDHIEGVPVHRCWHYVPERVTRWKRILHEATFVLNSLARVITRPRPDIIVAVSPPLLLGFAAWLASRLLCTRYLFHVQDLQPDAAIGLGMLQPSSFTRLLYALEAFAYRHAWRVSGISHGMLAAFQAKDVPPRKCLYFPNSITLPTTCPSSPPTTPATPIVIRHSDFVIPPRPSPSTAPAARIVIRHSGFVISPIRSRYGFSSHDFLAIYSGNIGFKQGLEGLVESAKFLRDQRVKIVICGDGAQRRAIELRAEGLSNVRFLPLLPSVEYQAMLAETDLAIITQTAGSGRSFFPSKLLSTFAAGRPVLSVADPESELAHAIRESGGGLNVPQNQPEELASALENLAADPTTRTACGRAGRAWVEQFETARVHAAFIAELETVLS